MKTLTLPSLLEAYHEYFHLGFGLFSFMLVYIISPGGSIAPLLFLSVIASFLPDLDHLLFIFIYGSHTEYGRSLSKYIISGQFSDAVTYIRLHHKSNHFILTHNLLTPSVSLVLFGFFLSQNKPDLAVFFLSWAMHYIFDMIEDLVALGKINPNWYLKFSK